MGIACAQQDSDARLPARRRPRALRRGLPRASRPTHARALAERLDHQEASVERFLELSDYELPLPHRRAALVSLRADAPRATSSPDRRSRSCRVPRRSARCSRACSAPTAPSARRSPRWSRPRRRATQAAIVSQIQGCRASAACRARAADNAAALKRSGHRLDPPAPALGGLLARRARSAPRGWRGRSARRCRSSSASGCGAPATRSAACTSSCSRSARGSRATPTCPARVLTTASGRRSDGRPAVGSRAGRRSRRGRRSASRAVIAQAHARGHGVGQRDAAARRIGRLRRPLRAGRPSRRRSRRRRPAGRQDRRAARE